MHGDHIIIALLPRVGSSRRSRLLSATLAALGTACAAIAMALHGHECSGDGCLLCLAAVWANALLCFWLGASVALPVVRILMHARVVHTLRFPRQDALPPGARPPEPQLPATTPLSMGVMLRI